MFFLIRRLTGKNALPLELLTRQQDFAGLIQQHRALIFKVCHVYCKTEADREDLFQEVVYQLWKSYSSFRGQAAFSTWMYRVAINTAISGARRNKLGRLTTYMEELPQAAYSDDSNREQIEQLRRAIAHLNDVEKSIVMLYLEEKSYEEMEAILGINQNNLRVKMNRIKEKLRKVWN
jgi:RNA polymerase sigma-70 factor (ECF subfamily)